MPVVFFSPQPGDPTRSVRILQPGEVQQLRKAMTDLETELRNVTLPSKSPVSDVALSGSFPAEEIALILAQNKDCTHISFMTGWTKDTGHFTLIVPMKDVVPGDPHSGTIIDKENTLYTAVCCQHPPFLNA